MCAGLADLRRCSVSPECAPEGGSVIDGSVKSFRLGLYDFHWDDFYWDDFTLGRVLVDLSGRRTTAVFKTWGIQRED